jgi:hypothetical protein
MSQRTSEQPEVAASLLERDGRFFFFQPDTGIIVSDEDIDKAYGKFVEVRRAFRHEAARAGLTPTQAGGFAQPGPAAAPGAPAVAGRSVGAELGMFVAKFAIALVLIGAICGVVISRAADGIAVALDRAIGPAKSISLADISRKAADIVKDIRSLTKEEKEQLRQSIGAISRELDPIADAWRNPPP